LTDQKTRLLLSIPPARLHSSEKSASSYVETDSFISIRSHPISTQVNVENEFSGSSDSESGDSNYITDDETIQLSSRHKVIQDLEHLLAQDSAQPCKWEELLDRTLGVVPHGSMGSTKARAEITVSVLDRAFKSSHTNTLSPSLRLKYLQAGEDIWHESRLRYEWEDAISNIMSMDIWMEWLNWRLRCGSGGISTLIDAFTRVKNLVSNAEKSEIAMVKLLWRAMLALQQAG
jgi:hypothetical protein